MTRKVEEDVISFDFDVIVSDEEVASKEESSLNIETELSKKEIETDGEEVEKSLEEEVVEKKLPEDVVDDSSKVDDILESLNEVENYSDVAVEILGNGFTIVIPDGDGEKEIPINEANLSKSDFIEVVKSYIKDEKQRLKDNSISIRGLDETTVSIINAVKKSKGSLKEVERLLRLQDDFITPLRDLDLDKEEDQISAIRMRYEADSKYEPEMIDALIFTAKSKGELKETALKSFEELENVISREAERVNKELEEREIKIKENLVAYRNQITEDLVKKWGLKESFAKRVSDFAGKQNTSKDSQHAFDIDKRYLESRQDKNIAPDLALFLYDGGETFKKIIKEGLKTEVNIENQRKIRLNSKTNPGSGGTRIGDKEDVIPFDEFL